LSLPLLLFHADVIIPEGGYNQRAIDIVVAQIKQVLDENMKE